MSIAPVVVVVGRVLAARDGVVTTSAGDNVHGALVGRGVAIAGWVIVAVVVCHFRFQSWNKINGCKRDDEVR